MDALEPEMQGFRQRMLRFLSTFHEEHEGGSLADVLQSQQSHRVVSYAQLQGAATQAERVTFGDDNGQVKFDTNEAELVHSFVTNMTDAQLARMLAQVPARIPAHDITGVIELSLIQRFVIALHAKPHDNMLVRATFTLSGKDRTDAQRSENPLARKGATILETREAARGRPDQILVLNLPTGSGKTMTSLLIALVWLAVHYDPIASNLNPATGSVRAVQDAVAPVAVVETTTTTFCHFVDTASSCALAMKRLYPHLNFVVKKTCKQGDINKAAEDTNTIVIMVVSGNEAPQVMTPVIDENGTPRHYVVPFRIYDEVPSNRHPRSSLPVLFSIVTQATKNAFRNGSKRGPIASLCENGEYVDPSTFWSCVKRNANKEAIQLARQVCNFAVATSDVARHLTCEDMCESIPDVHLHTVISAARTLLGILGMDSAETEKHELVQSFRSLFRGLQLTTPSMDAIFAACKASQVDVTTIIAALRSASSNLMTLLVQDDPTMQRVIRKLEDMTEQCPICLDDGKDNGVALCRACGFVQCSKCAAQLFKICIGNGDKPKCPHCRAEVPPPERNIDPQDARATVTTLFDHLAPGLTFESALTCVTSRCAGTLLNCRAALEALKRFGYTKIVLVLSSENNAVVNFDIACVGMRVMEACLTPKGKVFQEQLRELAAATVTPTVLVAKSSFDKTGFFYGTDLKMAQALVLVGDTRKVKVQAINRLLRRGRVEDKDHPLRVIEVQAVRGGDPRNVAQRR